MVNNSYRLFFHLSFFLTAFTLLQACSFSNKTTQRYYEKASINTYDVVAVPGVPFTESGWDSTMKARVYWAKHLYDKGIAKNIMFSGSSVGSPYFEGEIMALYAIALGVPREHVYSETKAKHSVENLYYVFLKSKKIGLTRLALATDPFQAKQLKKFARKRIGEDVGIIPIVFDTLRKMQPFMINPQIDYKLAYDSNFVSLKSTQSFWRRLRGTMGKDIDYNAY